jgi:Mg2+/Co2+ transporter CorB
VQTEDRDRLLGRSISHRTVEEIMHHRTIEMIDADKTRAEIITQALASHTRFAGLSGR